MYRILVVANRTSESVELVTDLRERHARRPITVTLLVPATWEVEDPHGGTETARRRLRLALERLHAYDIDASGVVGDPDPMTAFTDVWRPEAFDEVIVCTLSSRFSAWLKRDLPSRIRKACGDAATVSHIVGTERRPVNSLVTA